MPKNQWIWKKTFLDMVKNEKIMKFMSKIITQEYEHNMDFVGNIDFDSHLN